MRRLTGVSALAAVTVSLLVPVARADGPTLLRMTGGSRVLLGREYTWCAGAAWTGVPMFTGVVNSGAFCTVRNRPGFEVTGLLEGAPVVQAGYSCLPGTTPPYPADPYVRAGERMGSWSHDEMTADLPCVRVGGIGPDEARIELALVHEDGVGTATIRFTAPGAATQVLVGTVEFSNLTISEVGYQDRYVHAADFAVEVATE